MLLLGKRPLIMGIVNATPDSFSGDGLMNVAAAVEAAGRMIAEGADILDIGGESSRPGAVTVEAEEEKRRVVPVIAAIHEKWLDIPVAVDTVKASVAEAAIAVGASIVNDISALEADPAMAKLAAMRGVHVVLMHNRASAAAYSRSGGEHGAGSYKNVVEDVIADLQARKEAARAAGISAEKIIVDPGIGFGKSVDQNCALVNRIDMIRTKLACPVLIGPSRKSFIGKVLNVEAGDRLAGTAAAAAIGVLRGADIIRVHDVQFIARTAQMASAIAHSGL
ncbi:MAG: dihydropteroate synthase [Bdellovibrionales bacterium]